MTVLDRIEYLRQGRTHHGWLGAIGISNDQIKKIKDRSELPSANVINTISKCENASLIWLTEGTGTPYRVATFDSDSECKEALAEYLIDEPWTVYLVSDYSHEVLVLTLPAHFERTRGGVIEYTAVEILTNAGKEAIAEASLHAGAFKLVNTDSDTVSALSKGEMGSFALLGDSKNDGLLTSASMISMTDRLNNYAYPALDHIAENSPGSFKQAKDEQELLEHYRKLSPENKLLAMSVIKNFS